MVSDFTSANDRHDASASRPVLIVDDDQLELSFMAARLTAAGYAVTTAQSGADACERMRQQSFPVVITDYQMPVMNGLQLVDRVREQEADHSYFILWSIRASQEDRDRSFSHGVDDHISKQAPDTELLSRIEIGFETVAKRESLRRGRLLRSCSAVFGRNRDTDTWNLSATHLHAEMVHAARSKEPLAVMLLHVERQLTPREKSLLTLTQFDGLVGAIGSILRCNIDFALPLDAGDGLVRVLLVLPTTSLLAAQALRGRLCNLLLTTAADEFDEPFIDEENAEPAGAMPDCALGVAAIENWEDAANAAVLIAAAERHMVKLALPAM